MYSNQSRSVDASSFDVNLGLYNQPKPHPKKQSSNSSSVMFSVSCFSCTMTRCNNSIKHDKTIYPHISTKLIGWVSRDIYQPKTLGVSVVRQVPHWNSLDGMKAGSGENVWNPGVGGIPGRAGMAESFQNKDSWLFHWEIGVM